MNPWSKHEKAQLRRKWGTQPVEELADHLGRSVAALRQMARALGLTPKASCWTGEQEAMMRELYGTISNKALSLLVGKPVMLLKAKARHMGIARTMKAGSAPDGSTAPAIAWTPAEIEFLKTHYGSMPAKEIAATLGRPIASTISKASQLGFSNRTKREKQPIGAEYIMQGVTYRKVSMTGKTWRDKWKVVHRMEWEAVHGPIPAGLRLVRKDITLPFVLDNMQLVDNANWIQAHSINQWPPDLREVMRLRKQLNKELEAMEA